MSFMTGRNTSGYVVEEIEAFSDFLDAVFTDEEYGDAAFWKWLDAEILRWITQVREQEEFLEGSDERVFGGGS